MTRVKIKERNTSLCSPTIISMARFMEPIGPRIARFGPYTMRNAVTSTQ